MSYIRFDPYGNKHCYNEYNEYHNEYGPAVIDSDGCKEWWVNGLRHRKDGPAVEYLNGDYEYWQQGIPHRLDGPAMLYYPQCIQWFICGERLSPEKEHLLNIWYEKNWMKTKSNELH